MHVRMSGDPVAEGPHIKICQQDDGTNTQIGAKHELVEAERASVAVTTYQVESGGVIADRTGVLSSGCLLLLPPPPLAPIANPPTQCVLHPDDRFVETHT